MIVATPFVPLAIRFVKAALPGAAASVAAAFPLKSGTANALSRTSTRGS